MKLNGFKDVVKFKFLIWKLRPFFHFIVAKYLKKYMYHLSTMPSNFETPLVWKAYLPVSLSKFRRNFSFFINYSYCPFLQLFSYLEIWIFSISFTIRINSTGLLLICLWLIPILKVLQKGKSHWRHYPGNMGKHFDLQGSETAIVLLMGILLKPFQTLFWATTVIPEDQGLHKIVLRWEVYGI